MKLNPNALPIYSSQDLFKITRIDHTFSDWKRLAGLDHEVFVKLMEDPFREYSEMVQLAPASEAHHHAGPGGLLKHTYEVISIALKRRKSMQLPLGGEIAEINEKKHLWTCAIFCACLLHDLGKLIGNIGLIVMKTDGHEYRWTPHDQPLLSVKDAISYRIEFFRTPYDYHHHVSLTLFSLIPKSARAWFSLNSNVMHELCAYLWGNRYESGAIGEIVELADRDSTAINLKLPQPQRFSNAIPVIDRYMMMIRGWLKNGDIRVNKNGGMAWIDDSGHLYIVCRPLAAKIVNECEELGLTTLPRDPVRIYDILQEHGYAIENEKNKAIWKVKISDHDYEHVLTCLRFHSRRCYSPTQLPQAFSGTIHVVDDSQEETRKVSMQEHETKDDNEIIINRPNEKIIDDDEKDGRSLLEKMTDHAKYDDHEEIVDKNAQEKMSDDGTTEVKIIENVSNNITRDTEGKVDENDQKIMPKHDITEEKIDENDRKKMSKNAITEAKTDENVSNNITHNTEEKNYEDALIKNHEPADDGKPLYTGLSMETIDLADKFIDWLKKSVVEKSLTINSPRAKVHIVEEGLFLLAPGIFKSFLSIHGIPPDKNHSKLSKKFARKRINLKSDDGMNIQPYWVSSKNRKSRINGWIIPFDKIYEHGHPIPKKNKYISKEIKT